MSISQDELQKIATKLSKLPADNPQLLKNISDILEYVELLESVDTSGVIPTVSVVEGYSLLREDRESRDIEGKDLLACSPQKIVSDYIALPNIMK